MLSGASASRYEHRSSRSARIATARVDRAVREGGAECEGLVGHPALLKLDGVVLST